VAAMGAAQTVSGGKEAHNVNTVRAPTHLAK
jgi:hypothetical protein